MATGWGQLPPPHALGAWWVSRAAVWALREPAEQGRTLCPAPTAQEGVGRAHSAADTLGSNGLEKKNLQYLAIILNSPLEFMETHSCFNKPSISLSSPCTLPVSVEPFMLHAQKTTHKSELKTVSEYMALQKHNCFVFLQLSLGAAKIPILRPPNSRHTSQSSQREFPLSRRDLLPQCQQKSPSASSFWSFAHQSNKQQLKRVYSDMQHHTRFSPQKNQMQKNLLFWA